MGSRTRRHLSFRGNPLSLSISDPHFEAWLAEEAVRAADEQQRQRGLPLPPRGPGGAADVAGPAGGRPGWRSPLLALTVDDLRKDPLPWGPNFFGFGQVAASYSLPATRAQGAARLEGNLVLYLGNYWRLVCVTFLCFLYKSPRAAAGLAFALFLWDTMRRRAAVGGAQSDANKRSLNNRATRWCLQTCIWISLFYFRVVLVLLLAACVSAMIVVTHGTLRDPSTPGPALPTPQRRGTSKGGT